MPYKDVDKQKEANRKAVQAHRLRKREVKSVTPEQSAPSKGVTPEGNYRLIFAHGRYIQISI